MRKIAINGRFLVRNLTGQERFAREICNEIDKLVGKNQIEIIVPKYAKNLPVFENIKIIKFGNVRGHFWEQVDLLVWLLFHKRICLNLCTTCPILKPGITAIHDISQVVHPEFFQTSYGKKSSLWHRIMLKSIIMHKKNLILTVSNFSKNQMIEYLKIDANRIVVLGNGWNHIKKIQEDENIFLKYAFIEKEMYYLAVSSIMPQKNFKYILEVAKRNPNCTFIIAGKKVGLTEEEFDNVTVKNVFFLGYVTDQELKALLVHAKALIHPAVYEGFAITPLEALACGTKIIVANSSCLPEIYKDSAIFMDPYQYDIDLEQLLNQEFKPEKTLEKYQWPLFAKKLLDSLKTRYKK